LAAGADADPPSASSSFELEDSALTSPS